MIYKVCLLLTRADGIGADTFSREWQAALATITAPGWLSRCFNEPLDVAARIENAPPAAYDGVVEVEFDSSARAAAWLGSEAFRERWLEPRLALLGAPVQVVSGHAHRVFANPAFDRQLEGVKVLTLPVRRAGMAMPAFEHHWLVVHAGLALSGPDAARHLAELVSTPADKASVAGLSPAPFDGIGVIRFASHEAMAAEFASEHYHAVMAPDEPRFTDPLYSRAMPVRERARSFA